MRMIPLHKRIILPDDKSKNTPHPTKDHSPDKGISWQKTGSNVDVKTDEYSYHTQNNSNWEVKDHKDDALCT